MKNNKNNGNEYENLNKLPLLLWEYRSGMMRVLKQKFMEQLENARKAEKEYCDKHKLTPIMQGATYNTVVDLLDKCKTIFEIESLARYVFDENTVPSFEQVKKRAFLMELAFPVKVKP
ncbi:MAG: hypothetical protein QXD72_02390 [Candidatus Aenigmatarchaeota archaeon]